MNSLHCSFECELENHKKVFSLNNNFGMCLQHLLDFVELSFTIHFNKRISEIFQTIVKVNKYLCEYFVHMSQKSQKSV